MGEKDMTSENLILEKWFTRNGLAEGTRKIYEISIMEFKDFTSKSLSELIDEAISQQMNSIMPMNRSVNEYIFSYKSHLDQIGNAPGTVNHKIAAVRSFYKAYDIQLIDIKAHQGDTVLDKNVHKLLTKEDIRKMIDVSNARDRAILYLMALTGMAQNEVRNLTIRQFMKYAGLAIGRELETIEELFEYEKEILNDVVIFEILRKKVNYRHHVILPPEATRPIIAYLKERYYHRNEKKHINSLNAPIFVTNKGTPMTRTGIGSEIKRIGKLVGFKSGEDGAYSYWRPHAFRKYFISTIIRNTGDILLADYLVGHKISETTRAYWIVQPEEIKEKYLHVYKHLSIDSVRVNDLQTDDYRKMESMMNQMAEQKKIIETLMADHEFLKDYIKVKSATP